MGIIINSGLKIIVFKEFLVDPIVNRSAKRRGRRVTGKNSVVFSLSVKKSPGVNTIKPITNPLAINVKKQAANAVRNLPPQSP